MDKDFKFSMKTKKMTVEDGSLFDDFLTFHQEFATNIHANEPFAKVRDFVHAIVAREGFQADLLNCVYSWDATNTAMPMWCVHCSSSVPLNDIYEMSAEELQSYMDANNTKE